MKWRIVSSGRVYDPGEDAVVYFDTPSGDTHLLSDFAAHVLDQFNERSLSQEELVGRVSATIEPGHFPDLEGAVTGVLEQLVALDILKRE